MQEAAMFMQAVGILAPHIMAVIKSLQAEGKTEVTSEDILSLYPRPMSELNKEVDDQPSG